MHTAFVKLALLASFVVYGRAEDSCLEGPFAPSQSAYGGLPFPSEWNHDTMSCECRYKGGDTITGVEAWATYDHIEGIRFKFELSGWTPVHGNQPADGIKQTQKTEWKAGDMVCKYSVKRCVWTRRRLTVDAAVHMWNNQPKGYAMDAPAMIQIHDKDGKIIFQVGAASQRTVFPEITGINQGSGIILGAKTQSKVDNKNWINSLEFLMLKEGIVATQLINVKMDEDVDTWNKQQKGTASGACNPCNTSRMLTCL